MGNLLWRRSLWLALAAPYLDRIDTTHDPTWKAIVIPNGVANGVALKILAGVTTTPTVDVNFVFREVVYD